MAGFDIFLLTSFFRSKAKFVNSNNNKTSLLPSKKNEFHKMSQFLLPGCNKEHSLANLYLSLNASLANTSLILQCKLAILFFLYTQIFTFIGLNYTMRHIYWQVFDCQNVRRKEGRKLKQNEMLAISS